jgi:hypothetical protein
VLKNYVISLGAIFIFVLTSCTEEPPPTLSFKEREMVDSLFRLQTDSLAPLYDSLCQAHFDSAVQSKVDSMMDERLGEIEKYLERIKKENLQ